MAENNYNALYKELDNAGRYQREPGMPGALTTEELEGVDRMLAMGEALQHLPANNRLSPLPTPVAMPYDPDTRIVFRVSIGVDGFGWCWEWVAMHDNGEEGVVHASGNAATLRDAMEAADAVPLTRFDHAQEQADVVVLKSKMSEHMGWDARYL